MTLGKNTTTTTAKPTDLAACMWNVQGFPFSPSSALRATATGSTAPPPQQELIPFKRVYRMISSSLFLLGLCSFAEEIGGESDGALFLLSAFFSSLGEAYCVVHRFVTFPFIQRARVNLTVCLKQNSSKWMEKFLIPSVSGPHKLGLFLQSFAPFL